MPEMNPIGIYEPSKPRPRDSSVSAMNRAIATLAARSMTTTLSSRALGGGRASIDRPEDMYASGLAVITPFGADDYWRNFSLDEKTLDRVSPTKLMELLADISPEVSRALWDFLRMCNPGWAAKAVKPGTETQDKQAQPVLDAMLKQLKDMYGSFDVVIGRLFISAFLRGAFFSEIVLDVDGRMMVDLVTPDPAFVTFRRAIDPLRGAVWQMGQWQGADWVPLDRPTIRYIPVDPFPGKPDGRPLASSALFTSLFLMGMLHDLRRVIANQGYPRNDIQWEFEKLLAMMPEEDKENPQKVKEWADNLQRSIETAYEALEPDDTYIHSDAIKVNQPVGSLNASSLGAVDGLFKGLERMATRALKTMPLLMATTDGVSEANANRQWEIHVAGIKALQHLCESLLEWEFGLALQAQGIAASVQFRFSELRAAELLRDAQVELLNINAARSKYDNGWITQDEAALQGAGKTKAAEKEPRAAAPPSITAPTPPTDMNADPGSNRTAMNNRSSLADKMIGLVVEHTTSQAS